MNAPPPKFLSDNLKSAIQNPKWVGVFTIALAFVFGGIEAKAQEPGKIPRVGYVTSTGNSNDPGPSGQAFRQGLQDLGYIEGKNILVEYRYVEGNPDRIPGLLAELLRLKVDVLVATSPTAIRAAKQATTTIPIVMVTTQDPVAAGVVDSLARPGAMSPA